jgi:tripartite-type tricarboxylate transporter receptor subunit TctC
MKAIRTTRTDGPEVPEYVVEQGDQERGNRSATSAPRGARGVVALRRATAGAVMTLLAVDIAAVSAAERYPTHPVRALVPFAPGGATDIMARAISAKLSESLGQQVVVDNRAGAGGNIAAAIAARSAPDGHTLFFGTISTLATNLSTFRKLPYDPLRDFAPVTLTAVSPMFIVTHPSVPAASYGELVALARAKPGQLNYASSGTGGASHLMMELFLSQTGLKATHIPYKGAGPALVDLMAGQVQMSLQQPPSAIPYLANGKLRAHAVTSKRRVSAASEVPTTAEVGLPQFDVTSWQGLVVAKGTPAPIVGRLHSAVRAALASRELQERLIAEGSEPGGVAPDAFGEHIRREIARWAQVVKAARYTPE